MISPQRLLPNSYCATEERLGFRMLTLPGTRGSLWILDALFRDGGQYYEQYHRVLEVVPPYLSFVTPVIPTHETSSYLGSHAGLLLETILKVCCRTAFKSTSNFGCAKRLLRWCSLSAAIFEGQGSCPRLSLPPAQSDTGRECANQNRSTVPSPC